VPSPHRLFKNSSSALEIFLLNIQQGCGSVLHWEAGSGSAVKSKSGALEAQNGAKNGGPWTLKIKAWSLIMEPWRFCRSMVADSHHLNREHKSDLYGSALKLKEGSSISDACSHEDLPSSESVKSDVL
jgi:hypothetical protein